MDRVLTDSRELSICISRCWKCCWTGGLRGDCAGGRVRSRSSATAGDCAVSFPGCWCWYDLCGSHSAVCAHCLLPPALPPCIRTRVTFHPELLVFGSVRPSLPDRVGLLGFQEPGGILPVACLEKQGAKCGPPSLHSRGRSWTQTGMWVQSCSCQGRRWKPRVPFSCLETGRSGRWALSRLEGQG